MTQLNESQEQVKEMLIGCVGATGGFAVQTVGQIGECGLREALPVAVALAHGGGQRAAGQTAVGRATAAHVTPARAPRRRALDDRLVKR